ncbi:hypothetical protein CDL12_19298 [Handroanthus impetiginosus]|uniref:Retrovirus-related Pol polyprotein from transposon TNT 1-94-like beta-barrel domain-containing protein n=1 Tax=Handroanthus impetiginosus TaxID=429701 RepID=A0A2G9GS78_9LAMI|nr:hypothetical protein CDL12_19298 [Handroanthus impetiginosus]
MKTTTPKLFWGDSQGVEIKGNGNISVEMKEGRKEIHMDVYYVLDLPESLPSVGQLAEHGCSLHFENMKCKISDKQGRFVAVVKMSKNEYFPLSFDQIIPIAHAIKNEDLV